VARLSSCIRITIPSLWILWGLMGWKHLVSLRIIHLGIGLFMLLMVVQWVILLLLGVVSSHIVSWLVGRAMRVIPFMC
jgi:hypothetical protein